MIEARPRGGRLPLPLAATLVAVAGVGALVVQTLWQRELRLALGGAGAAISATLAALVIGQAGGARLGERVAQRAANPLRAFGALALAAALGALATPLALALATRALDAQYDALVAWPPLLAVARGCAALVATLPAALALGALVPALFAATLGGARTLGATGVGLYALGALASALGAALATFSLAPHAGLAGTRAAGVGLLAAAGAVAGAASLGLGRVAPLALAESDDGAVAAAPPPPPALLLRLAALSGFGSFAAQSLFAQALGRVTNQSSYAFGAVLVVALACIGLGALFSYTLSRRAQPQRALGVSLALAGCAFVVFPSAFVAATGGLASFVVGAPWPAYLTDLSVLAAATMAPVLLPAACVFPSLLATAARFAARDGRSAASATARLLAWNAAGALAGAVLAPLALIPLLGLWGAIAGVGALYVLGSLRPLGRALAPRFALYAAILALGLLVIARPYAQPALRVPPGLAVVAVEESSAGLVAVYEGPEGLALQLDNHYLLGGSRDRMRQERQGHLPLLLHARPRRVLFLGSATGSSASAALAHGVESIALVEIAPGVARAARAWFGVENRGVYEDARTRVALDDARSFVRATRERYDVVVGDLFVPWHAGSGSIFSVEHFAHVGARLADGGVFCQWLPLYQLTSADFLLVARSFARVFPAGAVYRGDFYGAHPIVALCGGANGALPLPVRALPGAADRWMASADGLRALYVGPLDARWLGEGPVESDAAPVLEFASARTHSGVVEAPFVGVPWAEFATRIARGDAARAGLLLQAASALYGAHREQEAAAMFGEAARLLPPELVSEAPADPSVAELWHARTD